MADNIEELSLNDLVGKIKETLTDPAFADDLDKSLKGNKAAGCRARKKTLELTKIFKVYRSKSLEAEKQSQQAEKYLS